MAQVKASSLREGTAVLFNNEPHVVVSFYHNTPGRYSAVVQVDYQNLRTGRIVSQRYVSKEMVEEIFLEAKGMQYLYHDDRFYHFMDSEDFHQIEMSADEVGENKDLLKENMELEILFHDERPVSFRLPSSIDLKVVKTVPGVKGNTVSNVYKPAKLETGLTVQVPLFVNEGDMIKVDTRTREYLARA